MHGSNLIKAIRQRDASSEIRCWGGDKMEAAGATLVKHISELAFMGFVEVLMNLRTIFRNLDFCKKDILAFKPDVLVLIDYPGFNLRIAKWTKAQNIKVVYYIAPQVWAWKENRVKKMKQFIDQMLVILPFEKDYFKNKWNWDVTYVGHPLIEEIERKKADESKEFSIIDKSGSQVNKPVIALLPGSRKQEIAKKLPVMLEVSKYFADYHFVVAQAPAIDDSFYQQYTIQYPNVSMVKNQTYNLLLQSRAALVTSGTATLETALFGVPEVVCYKGSPISYQIAKRVIRVKYISLVNLIMDKEIVKELIQEEMNVNNLTQELRHLLNNPEKAENLKKEYHRLYELLSAGGRASEKAAEIITTLASS